MNNTQNLDPDYLVTRGLNYKLSYDNLTIILLRSTYDRHPIDKTSFEGCKAFLRYNSLAKS